MKILYFDLGMGAAGDMISAALYDLLNDEQKKEFEELAKGLGIDNVLVNISKAQKCGINGSHISVVIDGVLEESYDEHEHITTMSTIIIVWQRLIILLRS